MGWKKQGVKIWVWTIRRMAQIFVAFSEKLNFNITDNLCTKQGNVGLKSEVYNQEGVIMARERYLTIFLTELVRMSDSFTIFEKFS